MCYYALYQYDELVYNKQQARQGSQDNVPPCLSLSSRQAPWGACQHLTREMLCQDTKAGIREVGIEEVVSKESSMPDRADSRIHTRAKQIPAKPLGSVPFAHVLSCSRARARETRMRRCSALPLILLLLLLLFGVCFLCFLCPLMCRDWSNKGVAGRGLFLVGDLDRRSSHRLQPARKRLLLFYRV